jgi:hypothetical protein
VDTALVHASFGLQKALKPPFEMALFRLTNTVGYLGTHYDTISFEARNANTRYSVIAGRCNRMIAPTSKNGIVGISNEAISTSKWHQSGVGDVLFNVGGHFPALK